MMKAATVRLVAAFAALAAAGHVQAQSSDPALAGGSGRCLSTTVYFTYGQDTLEQAALETIDTQINILAGGPLAIQIVGHVDAAEAASGQTGLGDRRAAAVAARFARRSGQTSFTVNQSSAGAANPAQPTNPGVREPLNRRAEIRACRV